MNRILKYFTAIIIVLVALSNSTDPPNGRTGAPGDGVCTSCHGGNNFDGNIRIDGLPEEVESGATYSLSVTVNNTDGNAVRAGFQMVSLFNGDFDNAGEFMKDSDDEGVSVAGGRRYIEHRGAKNFQDSVAQWIFDWEAPLVDEDKEIVMFAAGNIANGSGSSGDAIKFSELETLVKPAQENLAVAIEVTEILCNGETADLTANVTGGTEPFTYIWSNDVTTAENNGVLAGFYSVTVTDSSSDSAVAEIVLEEPDGLMFDLVVDDESGLEAADGSIMSNVSGGVVPYTFLWSNGATTADIEGLTEGSYMLTVTDANNCVDSVTVDVGGVGCSFTVGLDFNHVTCAGAEDGEAFIDPADFVQPLTFEWSNGDNAFIAIAGLAPGPYAITVTDGSGCTIVEEFQIEEPAALEVEAMLVVADCENPAVNALNSVVSGGTGSYTYLWSNDETTANIANVAEGKYAVEVTDENGCSTLSDTVMVSFTDVEPPHIAFTDSVSLFVNADGELDLSPLNLIESDNCGIESTQLSGDTSCDNLNGRTLTYEAVDINGNIATAEIFITSVIDTIAPTAICIDDIFQNGCDTVFYEVPVFMDNCSVDSIELAEGLPSGSIFPKDSTKVTYNAYDAAGNFMCCSFWVVTTNDLELTVDTVQDATAAEGGNISITVTGGTGNYTYEWILNDTSVVSSFEDVMNLEPGSYIVKVTDEAGCTVVSDAILVEMGSSAHEVLLPEAKLFPNPVSDYLTITAEENIEDIRVLNLNGQSMSLPSFQKNGMNVKLDMQGYVNGMYFVQLKFTKGWKTIKFSKMK